MFSETIKEKIANILQEQITALFDGIPDIWEIDDNGDFAMIHPSGETRILPIDGTVDLILEKCREVFS